MNRHKLLQAQADAEAIRKMSDGIIGPIGLDGVIGLIPGIGGLYSAITGMRLLAIAMRAGCGIFTILCGIVLVIADVLIGIVVGAGDFIDFLLRGHAMFAKQISRDIERKLARPEITIEHIEHAKRRYIELQLERHADSAPTEATTLAPSDFPATPTHVGENTIKGPGIALSLVFMFAMSLKMLWAVS